MYQCERCKKFNKKTKDAKYCPHCAAIIRNKRIFNDPKKRKKWKSYKWKRLQWKKDDEKREEANKKTSDTLHQYYKEKRLERGRKIGPKKGKIEGGDNS